MMTGKGLPPGEKVLVRKLEEKEFDDWGKLVSGSPDGSIFSLPEYLEILCRAAGGRFSVFGAWHGDELVGGIAAHECDTRFGIQVAPRHLLSYNSIVLRRYGTKYPSQQTARHVKILSGLVRALSLSGYARITLNCRGSITDLRPFLAAGWSASPNYTYIVPIADSALLWERMERNLRRLVQRCEKDGMSVTQDEDFDAFFRLHASTMRRKGRSPYLAEHGFRRYFEQLRALDLCRLFHARLPGGRAIATQLILLGPDEISHTVAAASDPEYISSGVNPFLRWKAFREVAGLGYTGNDLTGGGLTPVTHFKSQLGGDLVMFLALKGPRSLSGKIQDITDVFIRNIRKIQKILRLTSQG